PDPLAAAIASAGAGFKVMLTPVGRPLDQPLVRELAGKPRLILVCGRYEGIDARVEPLCDALIATGDYVLAGGEVPAMVLIEAVARLVPGVLGKLESTDEESFAE